MNNLLDKYLESKLLYERVSGKTISAYRQDLSVLLPLLMNKEVNSITLEDIKKMTPKLVIDVLEDYGTKNNYTPTTLSRKLASVKDFYKHYANIYNMENHLKNMKPFHDTRAQTKESFTREEKLKLIKITQGNPRDNFCMKMLFGCGLRSDELLSITKSSIRLDTNEIVVIGKGNKMRIVPLSGVVLESLINYLKTIDEDYEEDKSIVNLSYQGLRYMFTTYAQKVGIKEANLHKCRHTFASELLFDHNQDINTVAELLGHGSPNTTSKFYTHSTKKGTAVNCLDLGE